MDLAYQYHCNLKKTNKNKIISYFMKLVDFNIPEVG